MLLQRITSRLITLAGPGPPVMPEYRAQQYGHYPLYSISASADYHGYEGNFTRSVIDQSGYFTVGTACCHPSGPCRRAYKSSRVLLRSWPPGGLLVRRAARAWSGSLPGCSEKYRRWSRQRQSWGHRTGLVVRTDFVYKQWVSPQSRILSRSG